MVIISRSLCLVGCVRVITSAVRRDGEMLSLHQSNAMDASHILDWPVAPNVFEEFSPRGVLGSVCCAESARARCCPKRRMPQSNRHRFADLPLLYWYGRVSSKDKLSIDMPVSSPVASIDPALVMALTKSPSVPSKSGRCAERGSDHAMSLWDRVIVAIRDVAVQVIRE